MNSDELLKSLSWRYATKSFDPTKKISDKDFAALKESLRLAPSSLNVQPWLFLEINSKDVLAKLAAAAAFNKAKFETASNIIILARLKTVTPAYLEALFAQTSAEKEIPRDKLAGFEKMVNSGVSSKTPEQQAEWSARQTYIALGVLLASSAYLGIDACPMEGFDSVAFDSILGLDNSDYGSVVVVALGYRSSDDKTQFSKKVRRSDAFRTI
eukprot:jgi/Hompol1/3112/HPOL_006380-RA